MNRLLEKVSLLALSSMLISTYSISSALPYLLEVYHHQPAERVELLISLPSFMILLVLLGNRLIQDHLTERQIITTGLLLIGVAGVAPVFIQDYLFVFLSRLLLGLGVGLINAKAISIISEHFDGKERVRMLGLRGSAEVVGSSFLTVLVGFLIKIDWSLAFAIYAFAFFILLLYLFFVPTVAEREKRDTRVGQQPSLSRQQKKTALVYSFLAGVTVFVNTVVSMRIPLVLTNLTLATASEASYVLSLQQLIGIGSGILFGVLLHRLGARLGAYSYLGLGLAYLLMGLSHGLVSLAMATIVSGFFYSLALTFVFYAITEQIPSALINAATAIVLIGCNLGSALSPYLLKGLGFLVTDNHGIFLILSLFLLLLASSWLAYDW